MQDSSDTLVLNAMRLAEHAHRTRPHGPHHREAPEGEDCPACFIHLAEVGWMLQDAGLDPETVAAGYLHDSIEDCGYTPAQLAQELGNDRPQCRATPSPPPAGGQETLGAARRVSCERVTAIVEWVSETRLDPRSGRERSWGARNRDDLERLQTSPDDVRALSSADKTSNLPNLNRLLAKVYPPSAFTRQDHATQLRKFEALYDRVFAGHVPERLAAGYRAALEEFRRYGR